MFLGCCPWPAQRRGEDVGLSRARRRLTLGGRAALLLLFLVVGMSSRLLLGGALHRLGALLGAGLELLGVLLSGLLSGVFDF